MMKTILIVDDVETNIEILMGILGDRYDMLASLDGEGALELAREEHIDLILLDVMMPEVDGFEVCRQLKADSATSEIPVIFITAKSDGDSIEEAYRVGGIDYITKPFHVTEVQSRIANHLALFGQNQLLEQMVHERTEALQQANSKLEALNREIEDTLREVVFTLGAIGEMRSEETDGHVKRVARYTELLGRYYGLEEAEVQILKEASAMHDIGKVGIEDAILKKPDRLTPEEFERMKQHTEYGYEILKHSQRPLLKAAAIVAHEHHEKYDGSGYPRGLKGEGIHIYGRIVSLADVFDALGSPRSYKEAWSDEAILAYIKAGRGKQFDPKLVDLLFVHLDEFLHIHSVYH